MNACEKAESPLDLAGFITPMGREGFNYAINFIDDPSGAICAYLLKGKDDTPPAFKIFISDSSLHGTIKKIISDKGTEFLFL